MGLGTNASAKQSALLVVEVKDDPAGIMVVERKEAAKKAAEKQNAKL